MDFGPKWHADKQGTPTMGGILFIVGSIVATAVGYALFRFLGTTDSTALDGDQEPLRVMSCIIFCLLFGIIGGNVPSRRYKHGYRFDVRAV